MSHKQSHEQKAADTNTASAMGETPPAGDAPLGTLSEVIDRVESDPAQRDEHDFREPFHSFGRALNERGLEVPEEAIAEEIAFSVHPHDRQDLSSWGLYFGPFMSWSTPSGESVDTPPLEMMTPRILAYWRDRAGQSRHPIMRARYADLLWEMPKKLSGARPDAAMARVAIDAYLDAVEGKRYEHDVTAIDKARRALDLALSVGDADRSERSRDVLLRLEDEVAEDESLGLWGVCFDTFVEPPNRRVPLPDAERDRLVEVMEQRLGRLVEKEAAGPYHPAGAEAAALRLANFYRRRGRREDMARVLRTYGEAVKKMRETAPPLLVSHSLEKLYGQFTSFGMHRDADNLNEAIRIAGEQSLDEMKEISHTVEIPVEKVEAYYKALLDGSAQDVLLRIAVHFLPKRDELEAQLRELAQDAPLSFMMTRSIKDDDGRTIAHVGPLESDLEGQLLAHTSQSMQLSVPWLRESFSRGAAAGVLSEGVFLSFILACPLFPAKRRPIIEAGVRAFTTGDSMAAIHLLVPQVEQAVRQLATLIGAPIYAQRRGGGLHVRTLDDLLRDAAIGTALTENVVTYLRVLFTDARGWNVRNTVCHGLAPVSMLTMPVADRVLHAALVLSLIRLRTDTDQTTGDGDDSKPGPG